MTQPRPAPFSQFTTPEFWDDPHISSRMLAAHLDPDHGAASRTHRFIDASVEWLWTTLGLTPGARVLDLGCGPGVYAHRLAERGAHVHGIDVSSRSIEHARAVASEQGLTASFVRGNYLTDDLGHGHDAAIMIFEDFSALSPEQRHLLLGRVHDALAPGGQIVVDVTAQPRFETVTERHREEPDLMGGFFSAEPYVGVHDTFTYDELCLVLDRFTITTLHDQSTRVFHNWMHCLTPAQVHDELRAAGFEPTGLFGDVAGAAYDASGHVFAVQARRG